MSPTLSPADVALLRQLADARLARADWTILHDPAQRLTTLLSRGLVSRRGRGWRITDAGVAALVAAEGAVTP